MKQRLLALCLLLGLTLGAHWPALSADFVWDDTALVLRDPLIRSWRQVPEQFQHFLFTDATPSNFYRPIQRLTYTFDYAVGFFHPRVYHLTSIVVHLLATLALFFLALALLRQIRATERAKFFLALAVAAAWALHPLHSSVVDYVAGRADALAAMFGFLALLFVVQASEPEGRRRGRQIALAGLCLLASSLSKESGLAFIPAALLLSLTRFERRTFFQLGLGSVFVATIYLTLRAQAGEADVPRLSAPAPALVRPIIAARALAEYAGLFLLPLNLHMERDVESHPSGTNYESLRNTSMRELETVAGFLIFLGLCFWLWRAWKGERIVFTLLLLALATYLPIAGFWPLNATVAEHWVYVPSAFLLLALAAQLAPVLQQRNLRMAAIAATAVWVTMLGGRSFVRATDWQDARTFFQRTIAAGGDSARMEIGLGNVELAEHHSEAAETHFRRALEKEPQQPFAVINLAGVALQQNQFEKARPLLMQAAKDSTTAAQAHELLAVLEFKERKKIDLMRLRLASRTTSSTWTIEKRYIEALAASGLHDRAVDELKGVLRTEPFRAETWKMLAVSLAQSGEIQMAVAALERACELDVHLAQSRLL